MFRKNVHDNPCQYEQYHEIYETLFLNNEWINDLFYLRTWNDIFILMAMITEKPVAGWGSIEPSYEFRFELHLNKAWNTYLHHAQDLFKDLADIMS